MRQDVERNRAIVSTEQLLTWAYRDQHVHQARRGPIQREAPQGPLAAYSSLWIEGAPIEASADRGFTAAEDAWKIHHLVMGLGRYEVDCGDDLAAARYHRLGQYRGAEPPIGRRSGQQSDRPWPTHGKLDLDLRTLVIIHATRAARPMLPGREPVRYERGDIVWHPVRKTKVYAKGWFCHVLADGDLPGDLIEAWEVYMAWRGALVRLQREFRAIPFTMFSVNDVLPIALERPVPRPR